MVTTTFQKNRRDHFRRIADEALEMIKLSSELIDELCRGYGTFRLYSAEHAQVLTVTQTLLSKIRSMFYNRRTITIDVGLRRFLVNNLPIYEVSRASGELHGTFRKLEIGGMTFIEGVDKNQVTTFVRLLSESSAADKKRDWLVEQMAAAGINKIVLEAPLMEDGSQNMDYEEGTDLLDTSLVQTTRAKMDEQFIDDPRKIYQVACGMIKDIMHSAHDPEQINVKEVTRIAKNIVGYMQQHPNDLIATAIAGRIDDYQYLHPVNVAIYGARLAAPVLQNDARQLVEFVRIALLYDVGKSRIPKTLFQKSGPLQDEELEELHRHPVMSAALLDRHSELDKLAVVVAYEHHITEEEGSYPASDYRWSTNLITRIIHIVEAFDALIGNNTYRPAVAPHLALRKLLQEWQSRAEASLVTRLINTLGLFPVGTVVVLSTGETALVAKQTPNQLLYPVVRLLTDKNGNLLDKGGYRTTSAQCSIIDVIQPDKVPFDQLAYFPFKAAAQKKD